MDECGSTIIWRNSLFDSEGQKAQLWIKQQACRVFIETRYLHLSGVIAVERQGRHRFHEKTGNAFASSLLGNDDIADTANPTFFSPVEVSKTNDTVPSLDDRRIESLSDGVRQLSLSQRVLGFREHIEQFPSVLRKTKERVLMSSAVTGLLCNCIGRP